LSHRAAHQVKQLRLKNDLVECIQADPYFDPIKGDFDSILLDPKSFMGRAPDQVEKFIEKWVKPALGDDEGRGGIGGGVK
jgi:adenylosuccinate lyase